MALAPLSYLSPVDWFMSQPPRHWDYKLKHWVSPYSWKDAPRAYHQYIWGRMVSTSLQMMNLEYEVDEDVLAHISGNLLRQARAQARRHGMAFTDRPSNGRRTMLGELAVEWLESAAPKAVDRAHDYWDPAVAERLHLVAVERGKRSTPRNPITVEDLERVAGKSISIQARELNCSERHICYLRAKAKKAGA